ncbi:MAG: hypothetical protein IJU70_06985 [Lentisphaeria bacterium]|nr:hypothetical protein [Lentisphaeria bacterium]
MKISIFAPVLPALLLVAAESAAAETLPVPTAGRENLLRNSDFSRSFKCDAKKLRYHGGKKVSVKNGELPEAFDLLTPGQPQHARGTVGSHTLPDGRSRYFSFDTPYNKFDGGVALSSETVFRMPKDTKEPLFCGFWTRGNGTVAVKVLLKKKTAFQEVHAEHFLATAPWRHFRFRLPEKLRGKGELKVVFSAYGRADIAFPEVAPLPAVDRAARLLFYAPFDDGSLDAKFSRGPVSAFGTPALPAVKGIAGNAVRFDRKRRLDAMGKMRYPMGFGYDFLGEALDRDRGTIEFFFRPLDEMLTSRTWANFPLFYLGDTTWQWADAQDFSLVLSYEKGKLKLNCSEFVRKKTWPDEVYFPNTSAPVTTTLGPEGYVGRYPAVKVTPSASHVIEDPASFIGKFHHFAFTYDENGRTVWLDGKPVIRMKALKRPAVSSLIPKLLFANGNISHPGVMSSDLDELKIWSGVRYHRTFTPPAEVPRRSPVEAKTGKKIPETWQSGKSYLAPDGKALLYPLSRGEEKYTLEIACADGLYLLLSPRGASFNLRTDYQVAMPDLVFELKNAQGGSAEFFQKKRDTLFASELENRGSSCVLKLKLARGTMKRRVFLEPRVTLRKASSDWQKAFDGAGVRDILLPFSTFSFDGMFTAMPMAAAWNPSGGSALALAPESLCSWMSRGMTADNALTLKLRTVLDRNEEITFVFDLFSIDGKYGENDAVDRYHARHPKFFRLDDKVDPHHYGNEALEKVWDNPAWRSRKAAFSLAELNRRTRGSWTWFYYDASSTGNWSTDPELLAELAPVNLRHLGDRNFHDTFREKIVRECALLRDMGVSPCLYVSCWLDRRFQKYFSDSRYLSGETYNGVNFWPQYWCRNVIDDIMLPTGTDFGDFLRDHMRKMLKNTASCNGFSFDLCGYDYKFRRRNTLGGLNAFDENGAYLQHVTALAKLLDDMREMKNASKFRTAVLGNVDIHRSGFPSSFRQDNTIHEQNSQVTLQAEPLRRRQTRLQGERPTTFMAMPPLTGNYFGDEDPRLLRYAAVFDHHNHILLGMLYNIRQNFEIFGVKESVEALDELLRVQSLGHRQTAGAEVTGRLQLVRYGDPERGALAAVNSSPWKQQGKLTVDTNYFKAVPLIAVEGQKITVDNGRIELPETPPLSWTLLEFVSAVPGVRDLAYTSRLDRQRDRTSVKIAFLRPARLDGAKIRKLRNEKIELLFNGKAVDTVPEKAAAGDELAIIFRDTRYLDSAERILNTGLEKDGVIRIAGKGGTAAVCAGRIKEFFRWYATVSGKKYAVKIDDTAPRIRIVEDASAPAGIAVKDGCVVISGSADRLHDLTEEYLQLMEKRHPWHGVFGTQQPTRPPDWGATGMQTKFLKRHGLVGKKVSTKRIAEDFIRFLQEKQIGAGEGF